MIDYFAIILSIKIHHFQQKGLIRANQANSEELKNNVDDGLIDLRKSIIIKKFMKVKI